MEKQSDKSLKRLTIGTLSRLADVNPQTVRYYERQGLLPFEGRSLSGYRLYSEESVRRLNFIREAKHLGFSLKEIKALLNLRISSAAACDKVREKTEKKLEEVEKKLAQLRGLAKILRALIKDCDHRIVSDQCPILEKFQ